MNKVTEHLEREHRILHPHLEGILTAAHAVGEAPLPLLRDMTGAVLEFLNGELIPHAHAESEILYRAVDNAMGAEGATDTMRRDHIEVERYAEELEDLQENLMTGHGLSVETERSLRRVLYGLHALVSLHFAKEEEIYAEILENSLGTEEQEMILQELEEREEEEES